MRTVASIWLPTWPTDRLRKSLGKAAPLPDRPVVTVLHNGRRRVVASVDHAARAEGVMPGQPVAHAKMLVPGLVVHDATLEADLAGLARLTIWLQKLYTPFTSTAPPGSIWLDLTGCTHLWPSEAHLAADIRRRLTRAGFDARIAIAPTPGAAHALATFGREPETVIMDGMMEAVRPLSLAALRLSNDIVTDLRRLGFETVADVMRAPRAQLALRFGEEPGRRIDQLTAALYEPIEPIPSPEALRRRVTFVEPISTAEALEVGIERLVDLIRQDLDQRGLGARRIDLVCERVDGRHMPFRVGMGSPTKDPKHLMRLLIPIIERIEVGFGIEAMSMAVPLADSMLAASSGSLVEREPDIRDVAVLVDALANRLGGDRVYRVEPVESEVPERAYIRVPALASPSGRQWQMAMPRPAWLFDRPEPVEAIALLPDEPPIAFFWRQRRHVVKRVDGPERIHGEWWKADREVDAVREYFRIEDADGARFWLFRTGIANDARWYLHGLFGS